MRFGVSRLLTCWLIALAAAVPASAQVTMQPSPGDRLAYVSGGKLYVGFPHARLVPGPGNAFQPVFSSDGQWLAFLRQRWNGYDVSSQLWLARADGSLAHPVTSMGGTYVGGFQWSPAADVLAVQPMSAKGEPLPIRLIPVQGPAHAVPNLLQGSFLWLSDGRTLAIATTLRTGYTRLDLVSGTSVRLYSVPGIDRIDPIKLAAWWPDADSIVYWLDRGGCFSCIADGTPLYAFDLHTGKTRRLGIGLIYRDWIAVSGARLLAVTGSDRSAFFGKRLQLCTLTGPCRALPGNRPGHISLDPAWAPGGGPMAFVVAPSWDTGGFQSPSKYWSWLDAHVLWIARQDGSGAAPAGAGVPLGAQDPEWTRDGRGILFVKDGALWLDPHLGAANAHPITRLAPARSVPFIQAPVSRKAAFQNWYYGHMDWRDLFAWY
jgi:dipeptidyl aminopeptidase/acylaminoacyl peptidase